MPPSILLEVTRPGTGPGGIEGFRSLWAYYVNGYHPERHCQSCFKGRDVEGFGTMAGSGQPIVFDRMDRYAYVYVCGVGAGPKAERRAKNFHFPLKYAEGTIAEATTYNGYTFRAHNAVLLPIPSLPEGWQGKREEHVRCKNFQFAVEYFGYPPANGHGVRRSPAGA